MPSPRVMAFMLAAFFFLLWGENAPAGAGPCRCQDMRDIRYRLNQIAAALRGYEINIEDYRDIQRRTGGTVSFDLDEKNALEGRINGFIDGVKEPPGGHSFGANTDPACLTTYAANATDCLRAALEIHENVHVRKCQAAKGFIPVPNRWPTMISYAEEEVEAYKAEKQFLEQTLKELVKHCLALRVKYEGSLEAPTTRYKYDGETKIPLHVGADDSIDGQADLLGTFGGKAGFCTAAGFEKYTIAVTGALNEQGSMHLKTVWSGVETSTATCPSPLGPKSATKSHPIRSALTAPSSPLTTGFDLPALLDEWIEFKPQLPGLGIQRTIRVTVVEP